MAELMAASPNPAATANERLANSTCRPRSKYHALMASTNTLPTV